MKYITILALLFLLSCTDKGYDEEDIGKEHRAILIAKDSTDNQPSPFYQVGHSIFIIKHKQK